MSMCSNFLFTKLRAWLTFSAIPARNKLGTKGVFALILGKYNKFYLEKSEDSLNQCACNIWVCIQ